MLRGEHFAEVIVTPARFEPPGFDATLSRLLLSEQIERHMSQDDKVLLTVIFAHATSIFLKSDIKHPMQTIFNTPMTPHRRTKGSCLTRQTHDVIATFCGHLLTHFALRFDHANTSQNRPGLLRIEIGDAGWVGNGPILAMFQPSVSFVHAVMRLMHQLCKSGR